ncbi:MAG: RdgB/HAM1 family non-canonical purine NTP pyrophosphatase [Bacteroidales bacterium]|nr:RdgB/HAM1 family non-canonical purine NTP pyrophosphatase [Bacteroidales bacterium]
MEKRKLIFATNNAHKLSEVKNVEGLNFEILSLKDVGFEGEIPEDFNTLKENAMQKARFIHEKLGLDCFADDTGLEIDALAGRPGVMSARYAGPQCNSEDNIRKVLDELKGKIIRKGRFRTVIALIMNGQEHYFEGVVQGEILSEKRGEDGFGYDPIFLPACFTHTFAQMDLALKNKISHRAKATGKLIEFLQQK